MAIGTCLNPRKWNGFVDWKLLVLLILFLNVKLVVKIPALVIVYLLQPDFRFGFNLKNPRLPLFYLFIIVIAFAGLLVNRDFLEPRYPVVFITGITFWLLCLLTSHQVKLSVDRQDISRLHQTIVVFFILNAIVSAGNLLAIIWEIRDLNPYLYQGQNQKYFIGTGDYIKGLTFDTSTTNAILNGMGIIYFLTKKSYAMLLLCISTFLLTGSNFMNIVMILVLFLMFLFRSSREQKSFIVIYCMLLIVFISKVSPQNLEYVGKIFKKSFHIESRPKPGQEAKIIPVALAPKPDSTRPPDVEKKKEQIAQHYLDSLNLNRYSMGIKDREDEENNRQITLPKPDIHSAPFQSIKEPLSPGHPIVRFINENKSALPYASGMVKVPDLPGKAIGLTQTAKFLKSHPENILLGNGVGNFSSKLAFRTTGLGFAGGFPHRLLYINDDFMSNHLDLYLDFFSRQSGYHSLTNTPFSAYDQVLSEYGLAGLLALIFCFFGFFLKHYKILTYGVPLVLLMMIVFFIDYWFEQLSVLVIFELMMFLDIKESMVNKILPHHEQP